MEHDKIYEDTWEPIESEWLPYVKNDVLSTASCYARYTKSMEKLSNSGTKNSLTLPSLANIFFNILRDENYGPIYTYTDTSFRSFLRNSFKVGRCNFFNQH